MKLEFITGKGTDLLPFGMSRSLLRESVLVNKEYLTQIPEPENDMYESEGLILGFSRNDQLEYIKALPPSTAFFSGIPLVGTMVTTAIKEIERLGYAPRMDDGSCYHFPGINIVLFAPEDVVLSAATYLNGYYM